MAGAQQLVKDRADSIEFSLKVVFMPAQAAFEYCKSMGVWPDVVVRPRKAVGCNLYYPDSKRCVVVTPEPTQIDDDKTLNLGHEVLHCVKGRYHE